MNNGLKKVSQENLTTKVYDQIKNALMSGQFYPGDRLAIRPLAERLGTSPTPVREALLKLISYGALEMKPAHPIVVPTMTREKYLENRTLRISIEGLAVETAAPTITNSEIKQLKKIHRNMVTAYQAEKEQKVLSENHLFHIQLCKLSAMPTLIFIAEILWLQVGPFLNMLHANGFQRNAGSKKHEHLKIIEAFEKKDPIAARKALENDLIQGGAPLLDLFNGKGE